MPFMSVIVNAHNGAATLEQTLESILAQTFSDYEIVLWDDASSDDTPRIAARYAARGLRYFRSPGERALGLGAARQEALGVARGEWVAFLDQDDVWLPRNLEMQVALARSDPRVGLVYGRAVRFWPDGAERDFDHLHEFAALPEGALFERLWRESCFICISATLMRRQAAIDAGPIPPEITIIPDYFLYLGIARRWDVRAVQEVVCRYRMHAGNATPKTRARMQTEVLFLIDRWRQDIDPRLARRRMQVHSTVLAVEEMRRPGRRIEGLRRLLREGSVPFLLSRPFAWAYRALRRKLTTPYWIRHGLAA
ncbi:MAG TPA: glycosyltransferase [Usitatibacter sp.]|nr:glycosyltransferase [Usitatibacter sp.]